MNRDPVEKREWIEKAMNRYERSLVRKALRITGDIETARDVAQDTFLKLCKTDPSQIHGNLAAWLFTVCRNRALDVRKKEQRMGRLKDVNAVEEKAAGPGQTASNREAVEIVREVLKAVSEQQKEAFLLKFEQQMTYREIAEVMGKSLGTVSKLITSTVFAVRNRLRNRVKLAGSVR